MADVGVEGGGVRRADVPLTLYGENRNRPRPTLNALALVERIKAEMAKALAFRAFERSVESADDPAVVLPLLVLLQAEACAHEDAAEIIRARINRLAKEG